MSIEFYLACHDCRVQVAIAHKNDVTGPSQKTQHLVPQFAVEHKGHKLTVVDENTDGKVVDYDDYTGPTNNLSG